MFPSIKKTEWYTNNVNTVAHLLLGSLGQLQEQLKAAQGGEQEAKKLLAASERVLTKVVLEKNKLQDSNTRFGEDLKYVQA